MILWDHKHQGVVAYPPSPLREEQPRQAFLLALRERLRGRVIRAYVFGSFTSGTFRSGSDVDLLLVCDCQEPFPERARRFDDLYDLYAPLDILVFRPEELAPLLAEKTGFWKSVADSLREI